MFVIYFKFEASKFQQGNFDHNYNQGNCKEYQILPLCSNNLKTLGSKSYNLKCQIRYNFERMG